MLGLFHVIAIFEIYLPTARNTVYVFNMGARVNCNNAGHSFSRAGIYTQYFCMTIGTAHKACICLSWQYNIVHIISVACDEAFVFNPFNRFSDEFMCTHKTDSSVFIFSACTFFSAAYRTDLTML